MRCSVQNCTNDTKRTTKGHGITFHMFPKEPNLRAAWVQALNMTDWEPKLRSTICSEHFRNEDFYLTKCGLRKVKSGAVPILLHDSADDLDAPATLRVCRICLASERKMYHIREHKLDEAYQQITGTILTEDDRLAQKLCWECTHRLKSCMRFKSKALRSQSLMMDMIQHGVYITLRDIRSINRTHHKLESSLIQNIYESNDYDTHIQDGEEVIKTEIPETNPEFIEESNLEETNFEETEEAPANEEDVKDLPAEQIVKDESNEIFFNEYNDSGFNAEDDIKLSEVYVPLVKVKKKKVKVMKNSQRKVVSVNKSVKRRKEDETDPSRTMDKYRTAGVRRRKTAEALDESLWTVSALSYEEQRGEVEARRLGAGYAAAPYKCGACYRGFLVRDRYDAHVVRHSDASGTFECFICKTRLKSARALRKHLTAQHTEKFSCKGCPFVTRNRGVAREHERWHRGAKYQCPHCASEFDKLTTYLGHIRIKHVSDFVCEMCGYTFVSKKGIDVHKKKKHRLADTAVPADGPYCDVCEVRFVSEEAHARHLKLSSRHSSDSDPNRIRNDSQSMDTERIGRVVRRIEKRPSIHPRDPNEKEPDSTGPVTCEQCGVQLSNLRLYAQHFRRAHPDKNRTKYPAMRTPCMCEHCGRIFQSMALLKDHMWMHTGEKRFKCDRCTKTFTQKTNLMFHMRVHSAQRPTYECPLCGKQFAFLNNRRRHMFIHTGLKPFKCETCGKCFTTSGEQRAHVDHVHMKKPWPRRARGRGARDCAPEHDPWKMQHIED